MEPVQQKLFQTSNPGSNLISPGESADWSTSSTRPDDENPSIRDLDHHILYIVAAYIRKLPDNQTRKHLARLMINAIIKSANL